MANSVRPHLVSELSLRHVALVYLYVLVDNRLQLEHHVARICDVAVLRDFPVDGVYRIAMRPCIARYIATLDEFEELEKRSRHDPEALLALVSSGDCIGGALYHVELLEAIGRQQRLELEAALGEEALDIGKQL